VEVRFAILKALINSSDNAAAEGVVVDYTDNHSRLGTKKANECSKPYYVRIWRSSVNLNSSGRVLSYFGSDISHFDADNLIVSYHQLASRDIIQLCLEGIGPVVTLERESTVITFDPTQILINLREHPGVCKRCRNLIPFKFIIP